MEYYTWILSLHIIAVLSWMAMLFYLPRLFVYHVENIDEILDKIYEHINKNWNANIFKKVLIELEKADAY